LELAILAPLLGVPIVGRVRDPYTASRWCLGFTAFSLACTVGAWAGAEFAADRIGSTALEVLGHPVFALDRLNAPLLPLAALLHFLTALATARTKMVRFSFAWLLAGEALLLGTFACADPCLLAVLLAVGTVPPGLELARRGRPTRVYTLHMTLFAVLLFAGLAIAETGSAGAGAAVLMLAVLVRCGTIPAHVWVTDLFENCSFGTALLFVTPIVGMYAAVRLVLPAAPDWVLGWAGLASLLTAVYAAGMATVQCDARRYFAYLFVSYSSLVLVGLELHSAISLTGALALWVSVALSLTGLGLTLRAIEARFGRLAFHDYRGLYRQSPALAVCFLLTGLASVGFPGTVGFVAAELLVDGAVVADPLVGLAVAAAGAINGITIVRVYFLLFAGPRHTSGVPLGITPRERFAVLTLTALILAGGLTPNFHISSRHECADSVLRERNTHTSE
jgi:NADH-quinone oxidoreductase subunit M